MKLYISLSYFAVPKNFRLISTHYFFYENFKQLWALNHSSDISHKKLMNLAIKCIAMPYSLLVIYATLASDNPLCFRKILLEII